MQYQLFINMLNSMKFIKTFDMKKDKDVIILTPTNKLANNDTETLTLFPKKCITQSEGKIKRGMSCLIFKK